MQRTLDERDWNLLLRRIKAGKCTPFLGAGACHGSLPLGGDIARQWAKEYEYPLKDTHDLPRVAQFLSVRHDPMFPKERILDQWFSGTQSPDFTQVDEPHRVLADLPLPMYMTTNYDDFMVRALKHCKKNPSRELCRWNQFLSDEPSTFNSGVTPTVDDPVVFHLHGHNKVPESLVLTEDDYLDFLVNISKDQDLLPPRIKQALTGTSLLFIGYSLADWNFRVLFRGLVTSTDPSLRRLSITVQLLPMSSEAPEGKQKEAQGYLDEYFDKIDMRVYWGTAREFVTELRQRWEAFIQ